MQDVRALWSERIGPDGVVTCHLRWPHGVHPREPVLRLGRLVIQREKELTGRMSSCSEAAFFLCHQRALVEQPLAGY